MAMTAWLAKFVTSSICLSGRTADDLENLGGRRLLLQRLGKVPPRLGELAGALFELLFQLNQ